MTDEGTARVERPAPPSPMTAAAVGGALWGLGGYLLLWGYTPVVIHRSFVVSVPGTLVLLPVRTVLWGIRIVEERAGRPFEFGQRNAWIGVVAAVVGAAISVGLAAAARAVVRRLRGVQAPG